MIKRLHVFFSIMTVMLCMSITIPVQAQELTWDGEGTSENPYLISSKEHLQAISTQGVDKCYKLTADIDLTGGTWTPIKDFTGTLDGCGYIIKGLNVSVENNAGLFETIGEGGTVQNLGVTGSVTSTNGIAGGITGDNKGMIQNCYTNVTVETKASASAGGIAGINYRMIQNCYTTGAVTSGSKAGGIAGMNMNDSNTATIQYCYATGVITGNYAGGITGEISTGSNNCIALNNNIIGIGDAPQVGRITGCITSGSGSDNHAALSIPGAWKDKGVYYKDGADLTDDNFIDKGADEGAFADWSADNWDFDDNANLPKLKTTGLTSNIVIAEQDAKERAPFLVVPVTTITTQAQLVAIKDNLSGSYKLGKDITLTDAWTPLGGDFATAFTGIFDGCGFTISGLNVSMTESTSTYAGLFGRIDTEGTVKNLGVTGIVTVTTTGDYAYAYAYAGGIAGASNGKIMNCYTNVTVNATSSYYTYAGGIAGYMAADTAAISNCFATGNCTATSTKNAIAGGILGGTSGKGSISYCFATGTVEAKGTASTKYAGGIAGQSGTAMTGCIALNKGITGASKMTNRIAGKLYEGSFAYCYASPAIPGTWINIEADKLDGADLTSANFITSNDAFIGWRLGDNWQFAEDDFANLPTLMTTGLTPNIPLAGQTPITRTDYLDLDLVLIEESVTYDANLHKGKNLVIASTGILTVNTADAQVDSLEIQPGGQVTTTTALAVTKAMSTSRTLTNKWSTFGAPVSMKFIAKQTGYMLQGYESSEAAEQKWELSNYTTNAVPLEDASPYLLAIDKGSETVSFSSDEGITIPVAAKAESGSALSNGIFLFKTNPSLSNQTVTNVYILSDDGTRFKLQDTDYTLKPFECYVTANAATTKAVQSLRVAGGTPTGNEPLVLPSDAFRLWGANGQLHLEASQPTDVQVYTLTGTLAHSFRLDGSRTLTLPRGIYLVRSNNITYKVSL